MRTWADDDPKAALMTRKRTLIVDAALRAFLSSGYGDSSVNRIAADAGVSIKTLYRHFENKDDLFSAVMEAACSPADPGAGDGPGPDVPGEPFWFSKPPEIALPLAGEAYLRHAMSDNQLALYRVVTRDADRFPELGKRYHDEVIGRRDGVFAAYLDKWLPKTKWKVASKREAARAFASLLKSGLMDDALHGVRKPTTLEIKRHAQKAALRLQALFEAGLL